MTRAAEGLNSTFAPNSGGKKEGATAAAAISAFMVTFVALCTFGLLSILLATSQEPSTAWPSVSRSYRLPMKEAFKYAQKPTGTVVHNPTAKCNCLTARNMCDQRVLGRYKVSVRVPRDIVKWEICRCRGLHASENNVMLSTRRLPAGWLPKWSLGNVSVLLLGT